MELMTFLFIEYPQIFAIIEELSHYSGLVVIPDNIITVNLIPFSYIATNYPSISTMNEVLTLILPILQTLSANFLLMMMKKHRFAKFS